MRNTKGFKVSPCRQAREVANRLAIDLVTSSESGDVAKTSVVIKKADFLITRTGKSLLFQAFMGKNALFPFYSQKIRAPWGIKALENASERALTAASWLGGRML